MTAVLNGVGENVEVIDTTEPARTQDWFFKELPGKWAKLSTVWVGEISISPERGKAILDKRNIRNRSPRRHQIALLERILNDDQFIINGETVVFDAEGVLINGQNRMMAGVKSGKPINVLCVVGVSPVAFRTIDQQARRTMAQHLEISGERNTTKLAGAIRLLMSLRDYGNMAGMSAAVPSHLSFEMFAKHEEIRESMRWANDNNLRYFTSPSLIAALHYLFYQHAGELADRFFTILGEHNIPTNDGKGWTGVALLNKRLTDNLSNTAKLNVNTIAGLSIRAWNALLEGRETKQLRFNQATEEFPMPEGWVRKDGDLVLARTIG